VAAFSALGEVVRPMPRSMSSRGSREVVLQGCLGSGMAGEGFFVGVVAGGGCGGWQRCGGSPACGVWVLGVGRWFWLCEWRPEHANAGVVALGWPRGGVKAWAEPSKVRRGTHQRWWPATRAARPPCGLGMPSTRPSGRDRAGAVQRVVAKAEARRGGVRESATQSTHDTTQRR